MLRWISKPWSVIFGVKLEGVGGRKTDATCHVSHESHHIGAWQLESGCSLATRSQTALNPVPPFADPMLLVIQRVLTRVS